MSRFDFFEPVSDCCGAEIHKRVLSPDGHKIIRWSVCESCGHECEEVKDNKEDTTEEHDS
jgi:hypothetical protein